jgi:hypothetical protein
MLRLYVNGTEVGSRLFTGVPGVSTDDLQIGNYPGPDKFLNGAVDEIAVYDHALTGTQIRAHELGCANIDGASGPTYVPTSNDVGSTVRVVVTASNAAARAPLRRSRRRAFSRRRPRSLFPRTPRRRRSREPRATARP